MPRAQALGRKIGAQKGIFQTVTFAEDASGSGGPGGATEATACPESSSPAAPSSQGPKSRRSLQKWKSGQGREKGHTEVVIPSQGDLVTVKAQSFARPSAEIGTLCSVVRREVCSQSLGWTGKKIIQHQHSR